MKSDVIVIVHNHSLPLASSFSFLHFGLLLLLRFCHLKLGESGYIENGVEKRNKIEMEIGKIGRKDVFMSTTICEDRLSSHAMNCSRGKNDAGSRVEEQGGFGKEFETNRLL